MQKCEIKKCCDMRTANTFGNVQSELKKSLIFQKKQGTDQVSLQILHLRSKGRLHFQQMSKTKERQSINYIHHSYL